MARRSCKVFISRSISEWKAPRYTHYANGFSVFLQTLQSAFNQQTVSKVAYALVYMVLIIIALNSFQIAISYATGAIETMTKFILALVPLLLALMASSGGVVSAAFFIR